ncbi:MAG: polysaccharide deacetylase family protein [Algoriphagus sp.]|uniref:polysaccharide deacetylase family protein n=1 Tax=Algoriphagus sp. TaxID=1872435 RepID=UPI0017D78FE7|nr:polysaccharide deacetylase family protein [Algoriphagus sp.]NVJ86248.1 polysaccharide deacetylase family protein [Algoriphagus sp.]
MVPVHKTPGWIQRIFPQRIWQKRADDQSIYLTFDDGPVPGVTDYVLDQLNQRDQKATFFMVGDNVRKHPELALKVIQAGHSIGNHTFHHLHGLRSSKEKYLENIRKCDLIFEEVLGIQTSLFRPPYGWMTPSQAKEVAKEKRVVMWDVLSGDYDPKLKPQKILNTCLEKLEIGSIVVFHDQEKTRDVLPQFLPEFLDAIKQKEMKTGVL